MFAKWFVSKRKKTSNYFPPALPSPPPTRTQQQQAGNAAYVHQTDFQKAQKLGITVHEYHKRVGIIERELLTLTANVGDTVFPSTWEDYQKHGKLLVRAVCRHYDDYGDVEWNERIPFVVQVSPMDKPNETINCTVAWISKHAPVESTLYQDC